MRDSSEVIHSTVKIKKSSYCRSVSSMSAAIDVCWSTSFTYNDVVFSGKSVLQLTQTENFLINVRARVRLSLQLHPTGSLWTGTFSLQQEWWLHFLHLSHFRRKPAECERRDTCPVWVRCVILTWIKNIRVNIWWRFSLCSSLFLSATYGTVSVPVWLLHTQKGAVNHFEWCFGSV